MLVLIAILYVKLQFRVLMKTNNKSGKKKSNMSKFTS